MDYDVNLNAAELLRLDGVCRPAVQAVVNLSKLGQALAARYNVTEDAGVFLAACLRAGFTHGWLCAQRDEALMCPVCGATASYGVHRRTTRHHRKGDVDPSKLNRIHGVLLGSGARCCWSCWQMLKPHLADLTERQTIEVDPTITGHAARWKRWSNVRCTKCDWRGHEGQMGQRRTLMNDGFYPSRCPSCGVENVWLSNPIERVGDAFTLVPVPIPWCETPDGVAVLAVAHKAGVEHAVDRAKVVGSVLLISPPLSNAIVYTDLRQTIGADIVDRYGADVLRAYNQGITEQWAKLQQVAQAGSRAP